MRAILNRPRRVLQIAAAMFSLVAFTAASGRADIFQWEYINPANPSLGKQQGTTLAPDGAGVDANLNADLAGRDLTKAYLSGAIFSYGSYRTTYGDILVEFQYRVRAANLAGTNLSQSDLTNSEFAATTLTDADFTDADIRGARFGRAWTGYQTGANPWIVHLQGTGITLAELYSTESFRVGDLSGTSLDYNELVGGNFTNQNLTDASFVGATLTDANFTGAKIQGVKFGTYSEIFDRYAGTGVSLPQLYSTASYQAHDLSRIDLSYNYLADANFVGQNLNGANFTSASLTNADFRQANLSKANFIYAVVSGADFRQANLTDAVFNSADLKASNFAGQNLAKLNFDSAALTGADFTGAEVRGAYFSRYFSAGTGITLAQLYSTASYQAMDLSGIGLSLNNLAGANFAHQNLTNAYFDSATLTGADFHQANLNSAYLGSAILTHTDFRQANLTNASFYVATLTDAVFTDAEVRGARFSKSYGLGTGITLAQLYSTASYQAKDLSGIGLFLNNLTGGNFAGQNLTNVDFGAAMLAGANLSGAILTGANVEGARLQRRRLNAGAALLDGQLPKRCFVETRSGQHQFDGRGLCQQKPRFGELFSC